MFLWGKTCTHPPPKAAEHTRAQSHAPTWDGHTRVAPHSCTARRVVAVRSRGRGRKHAGTRERAREHAGERARSGHGRPTRVLRAEGRPAREWVRAEERAFRTT